MCIGPQPSYREFNNVPFHLTMYIYLALILNSFRIGSLLIIHWDLGGLVQNSLGSDIVRWFFYVICSAKSNSISVIALSITVSGIKFRHRSGIVIFGFLEFGSKFISLYKLMHFTSVAKNLKQFHETERSHPKMRGHKKSQFSLFVLVTDKTLL